MRLIVPLDTVPNQTLSTTLNGQLVRLNVYQRTVGLFVDVALNDVLLIGGVIALDRNLIVRSKYLGFIGDLAFFDVQGFADPQWAFFGQRFFLGYWSS